MGAITDLVHKHNYTECNRYAIHKVWGFQLANFASSYLPYTRCIVATSETMRIIALFLTCNGECCWIATAWGVRALLRNIAIQIGTDLDYIVTILKGHGLGNVHSVQHTPIKGRSGAVLIVSEVLLIDNHWYLSVVGISFYLPLHGKTKVFAGQLALIWDDWQRNYFCTEKKKERNFRNSAWIQLIIAYFIQRCTCTCIFQKISVWLELDILLQVGV